MGIRDEAKGIGEGLSNLGSKLLGVFGGNRSGATVTHETFSQGLKSAQQAAADSVKIPSTLRANVTAATQGSAKAGFWIVKAPVVVGMKALKGTVNVMANHPKTTLVAGGVAALFGIGHLMSRNEARRSAEDLNTQMMAAGAMQGQVAQSYKNVTSPADYAAMNAAQAQGANFADRAAASKEGPAVASV